jgi:LmbE family N-acetylglucosaminyl deacetylase
MARCVAEGWDVTLVCATRGEVGEISDPALATPETLPQVREQELHDAMAALGVRDVRFLGYRDSGMAGTPENADPRALANADAEEVVARYDQLLREIRPDVVITWDPSGGYGHPDHMAVHRLASEAVRRAEGEGHGPASLYYFAIPVEKFAAVAEELARQGVQMISDEMRASMQNLPHPTPTTAIDVRPFLAQKTAAMAAHRTQFQDQGPFTRLPQAMRDEFMATEYLQRVLPPWPEGSPEERELHVGARTPAER